MSDAETYDYIGGVATAFLFIGLVAVLRWGDTMGTPKLWTTLSITVATSCLIIRVYMGKPSEIQ